MRRFAVVAVVSGFVVGGVLVWGCTSSDNAGSTRNAEAYCPATVELTAGIACQVEGLVCSTGYQCGAFSEQARCTCTGGTFQCVDQAQNPFGPGQAPGCVDAGAPDNVTCKKYMSASQADGQRCTTAGLVCTYPNSCPPNMGVVPPDVCQCVGNGAGRLIFVCDPGCGMLGDGAVGDAFIQPDTGDDGSDANGDGATE